MKRLTLLSLGFLIVFCLGTNFVAALTISSTSTTINSTWEESWVGANGQEYRTSGTGMTSLPHGWAWASASVDSFNLAMVASVSPNGYSTPEFTHPWNRIQTSAYATTRFSTDYSQLGITLTSYAFWNYDPNEQDMQVTFRDITAATTLLDVLHLDNMSLWGEAPTLFKIGVDPTHEYELTLSGWTDAWEAKFVDMRLNVGISELGAPVPESSNFIVDALLLLPFGLRGMRCFRDRKS
jgi:hypothetical protein